MANDTPGGMRILRDVMVAMRDGVRLATDVYLPPGPAPGGAGFPVILERTPYGKHLPSRSERGPGDSAPMARQDVACYFAARGYAVVYQDCRGRYASEGGFVKYVSDAEDGYDACAWIVAQPWCNGRIGTKGLSYAAHTQAALGSVNAPGVVAMVLDSGGFSNAYQNGIRQGGAFEMKQATWALRQALENLQDGSDPEAAAALAAVDMAAWFRRLHAWRPGHSPLSAAPEYEDFVFEQWRHGAFSDYWRRAGLHAQAFYHGFAQAATLHISSWYDPYARSACDNFSGLAEAGKGPTSLILGPWTHGNRDQTFAGDVDFGAAATLQGNLAPDFLALRLDWFERYLKGIDRGAAAAAPVRIFVMGGGSGLRNADGRREHGGRWRSEPAWPLARAVDTRFYLHAGGGLAPAMPCEDDAALSYDFDPDDPAPTHGGAVTSGEPLMSGGAFDQGAPGLRADVLSFQTPPLDHAVEITGPVSACLWVASDRSDTDFTFKLIDVAPPNADYPDGYAMNLTDGILRLRYRDAWDAPAPLAPGLRYRIVIEALPTSNLFKKGHAIRVDISSSNFPRFDTNPNSGGAEGVAGPVQVARNTLYLDRRGPSHLVLPVVPTQPEQAMRDAIHAGPDNRFC